MVEVMSDLDTTTDRLDDLATEIRDQFELGKYAVREALDAQLAIGRCLMEARQLLPSDNAFGAWFRSKEFPFQQKWAWTLRQAAENEVEIRAAVSSQLLTGEQPNLDKAVKSVVPAKRTPKKKIESTGDGTGKGAPNPEPEVDTTPDTDSIEGTHSPGERAVGTGESAGGGAPHREDGDGVSPVFTPPPPPVDTVTPSGEVPRPSDDGVDGDSHGGPRDVVTTELDASAFDAEVSVPEEGTDPVHETGVPDSVEPAAGAAASQPHPPAAGSGYGQGVALPAESKKPKLDAVGIGRSVLAAMSVGIPDNVDHLAAGIRTLPDDERGLLRDRAERARKQADLVLFTLDAMAKEDAA